jgi:biopolymer transport protein ExbB
MIRIFFQFIDRGGGLIMWSIFIVSVVIWALGIHKLFSLFSFRMARNRFYSIVKSREFNKKNRTGSIAYDSLLNEMTQFPNIGKEHITNIFKEFLIVSVPHINRGSSVMTAWISIAPLLGLLGTVSGMIETFNVIMRFGVGNPSLTAEGISIALLTTQAGLTVAFPGVLFQNFITSKRIRLIDQLLKDGEEMVAKAGATLDPDNGKKVESV